MRHLLKIFAPLSASWLILALVVGAPGCGDPCKDLSNKICRCEPTDALRRSCIARVSTLLSQRQNDPNSKVEQDGRNFCANTITGCTCDALAAGNYAACGLSKEPAEE